jgi:hypothetical protein
MNPTKNVIDQSAEFMQQPRFSNLLQSHLSIASTWPTTKAAHIDERYKKGYKKGDRKGDVPDPSL